MSITSILSRLFGGTPASTDGVSRAEREKAQEEFKTAVRDSDVPAMEALLASQRIRLTDELAGGRGLLQFAVMVKSAKAVRLLVARGADASTKDTLGASATTLANKSGNAALIGSLQPA